MSWKAENEKKLGEKTQKLDAINEKMAECSIQLEKLRNTVGMGQQGKLLKKEIADAEKKWNTLYNKSLKAESVVKKLNDEKAKKLSKA